ncbi:MAG: type I-U CRISPR-associated protein Csx17, partial [Candidatus Eremiobacterota bacterium]
SLASARWAIDQAVFEMLQHGTTARCVAVFAALGRFERVLSRRDPSKGMPAQPPGRLSPRWILHADDGSLEVRLAAALASIYGSPATGPLRCNWAPIEPRFPTRWTTRESRQAWSGNSLPQRLVSALRRRLQDWGPAGSANGSSLPHPLAAALPVHPQEVAAFLTGAVDDSRLEDLLMGFGWVDWRMREDTRMLWDRWGKPLVHAPLPRPWCLLKLLFWPKRLKDAERQAHPDVTVVSLLQTERGREACERARRSLRAVGLNPYKLDPEVASGRLAASLMIPVRSAGPLLARATYPKKEEP